MGVADFISIHRSVVAGYGDACCRGRDGGISKFFEQGCRALLGSGVCVDDTDICNRGREGTRPARSVVHNRL